MPLTLPRANRQAITKKTMDGEDACIYLNICYRTLKKLFDSGELIGRKVGRRYFFTKENLDKWLNGGTN